MLETMTVLLVMGIVIAVALPYALNALRGYRLHAEASDLAAMLNLARMKAASQYAPYRLDASPGAGTYVLERLCGNTPSSGAGSDPNCTSAYNPFTAPNYDSSGTQYVAPGNKLVSCLPLGLSTYPGAITASPAGCPSASPDPLQLYFNTRGSPVDNTGSPLANGGAALYVQNQNNAVDAVTVSVGGRVAVWNWDVKSSAWYLR